MSSITAADRAAHIVNPDEIDRFQILGPVVEYLTPPRGGEPCVMRGTIPAGTVVPMHSHSDPETFLPVSGEIQGLRETAEGCQWVSIRPGDVFHVPGGAKHGFRNRTDDPAVMVIVSTDRIGRFFQEIGSRIEAGRSPAHPTAEVIERFLETSERYGYWNATPEENAAVGIPLAVWP